MTSLEKLGGARGVASGLILAVGGLALATICFRATVVKIMPPASPAVMTLAPATARAALLDTVIPQIVRHQPIPPAIITIAQSVARAAPLDARPYLVIGAQAARAGDRRRALQLFLAGQRLDPRNRVIHYMLLEQYINARRFDEAAGQFAVLARLAGEAQQPIANAMAQMMTIPSMRDAVRSTLRADPRLEQAVLIALAKSTLPPAELFRMASPVALANAGAPDSWGPALIARLTDAGLFQPARAVWQRVYRLPASALVGPIFDANFQGLNAVPPFGWTLTANSLGAADARGGSLSIDYYGRDSGDLASQMLVLSPGRYRLSFVADGGRSQAASGLSWAVSCATGGKAVLIRVPINASPGGARSAGEFAVPADCPAQSLTLHAEANEFPTAVNLAVRQLSIEPVRGTAS